MRASATAILARNETWSGRAATEPHEAGWAREAVIFVRALKPPTAPGGTARIQVSPDGILWVDEGTRLALPTRQDEVTFARVAPFGNWLRVAADIPTPGELRVLVTAHFK